MVAQIFFFFFFYNYCLSFEVALGRLARFLRPHAPPEVPSEPPPAPLAFRLRDLDNLDSLSAAGLIFG
jgi:hypothetical protein